jgi:hypothetical protein
MNKVLYFILAILMFSGCSSRVLQKDVEVATTVKKYIGFSKDDLLNAAKKVFKLASKDNFIIDSYRESLVVTKAKANYEVVSMSLTEDKFEFRTKEIKNGAIMYMTLNRTHGFDQNKEQYFSKRLHDFFWQRIDYVLGLRDTWPKCIKQHADLRLEYNSVLCDTVDLKNKTPKTSDLLYQKKKTYLDTNVSNDSTNSNITLKELDSSLLTGYTGGTISFDDYGNAYKITNKNVSYSDDANTSNKSYDDLEVIESIIINEASIDEK